MRILSGIVIDEVKDKFGIMPNNKIILDVDYVMPTKNWIVNTFSPAFYDYLKNLEVLNYIKDKNDCDNYSLHCRSFALMLHARDNKSYQKGFAFGEFHYDTDKGGAHAINFFITLDENTNTYVVYFYEPQTQQIVELSQQERRMCRNFII